MREMEIHATERGSDKQMRCYTKLLVSDRSLVEGAQTQVWFLHCDLSTIPIAPNLAAQQYRECLLNIQTDTQTPPRISYQAL